MERKRDWFLLFQPLLFLLVRFPPSQNVLNFLQNLQLFSHKFIGWASILILNQRNSGKAWKFPLPTKEFALLLSNPSKKAKDQKHFKVSSFSSERTSSSRDKMAGWILLFFQGKNLAIMSFFRFKEVFVSSIVQFEVFPEKCFLSQCYCLKARRKSWPFSLDWNWLEGHRKWRFWVGITSFEKVTLIHIFCICKTHEKINISTVRVLHFL